MGVYSYDSINKNLIPVAGSGSDMTGATSSTAGTHGLAPAPQAGDQNKFLKGDGTWGAAATDDNFVGTLAEWNALTPAEKEQYNTADITDDFNDMPVDHTLSLASENPVQNKVITEALNTERQTVVNEIGAITSELENKPNTFTGTQAQWDALTAAQKAQYTLVCINDDLNFTPPIDDALSTTSERAVQNKVVTAKLNELTSVVLLGESSEAGGVTLSESIQNYELIFIMIKPISGSFYGSVMVPSAVLENIGSDSNQVIVGYVSSPLSISGVRYWFTNYTTIEVRAACYIYGINHL